MSLKIYIKEPPRDLKKEQKRDRLFGIAILSLGLFSILFAVGPSFVWQLNVASKINADIEDTPIPKGQVLSERAVLEKNVQVVENPDGFSYFSTDLKPNEKRPKEFYVTIPKLKIKNAKAKVGSLNFAQNLSHFPGSALPGEVGNSFVTGHSVLPQFNDPEDYHAIFTKLSDLEVGDVVFAELDGKTFKYVVQYSKIVNPKDVSVLLPISQNGKNLTLMTCVPPGSNSKRLVVITSLI